MAGLVVTGRASPKTDGKYIFGHQMENRKRSSTNNSPIVWTQRKSKVVAGVALSKIEVPVG